MHFAATAAYHQRRQFKQGGDDGEGTDPTYGWQADLEAGARDHPIARRTEETAERDKVWSEHEAMFTNLS